MNEEKSVQLWDYWCDYKLRRAYCMGIIYGVLYFSESELEFNKKGNEDGSKSE